MVTRKKTNKHIVSASFPGLCCWCSCAGLFVGPPRQQLRARTVSTALSRPLSSNESKVEGRLAHCEFAALSNWPILLEYQSNHLYDSHLLIWALLAVIDLPNGVSERSPLVAAAAGAEVPFFAYTSAFSPVLTLCLIFFRWRLCSSLRWVRLLRRSGPACSGRRVRDDNSFTLLLTRMMLRRAAALLIRSPHNV
jgi:hypothetical protein